MYPETQWPIAEPSEQGVDTTVLAVLDREFASGQHGYIDGMLIIRNGWQVYQRQYQHDYDAPFRGQHQARGPYNYYDPDWHPWLKRGPLHTISRSARA